MVWEYSAADLISLAWSCRYDMLWVHEEWSLAVGLSQLRRPWVSGRERGDAVVIVDIELVPDPFLLVLWLGIHRGRLVLVSLFGNLSCNPERALPDLGEGRVHSPNRKVIRSHLLCQGLQGKICQFLIYSRLWVFVYRHWCDENEMVFVSHYTLGKFAFNYACTVERHWDSQWRTHRAWKGKRKFTNSLVRNPDVVLGNP